jgi:hypothetical protein
LVLTKEALAYEKRRNIWFDPFYFFVPEKEGLRKCALPFFFGAEELLGPEAIDTCQYASNGALIVKPSPACIATLLPFVAPTALIAESPPTEKPVRPYRATRKNDLVEIVPLGLSFPIPQPWLGWNNRFHNNLHLTEEELAAVKTGEMADWDPEYAIVVNAVLPFERCALHAGGEGWGREGVSYADLQMRVYVLDEVPEKVEAKVAAVGVQAVRTLFTPRRVIQRGRGGRPIDYRPELPENPDQPPKNMKVPVERSDQDGWRRVALSYDLHYGDYGATASVDFRLRRMSDRTVAVVFMHTNFNNQASTIRAILGSFVVPK